MQLYLRHVILVFLIILGLAPVVAQITINRPELLAQVQSYAEEQKMDRLTQASRMLEQRVEYLLNLLRLTASLPAPREVLGFGSDKHLNSVQARERFGAAMQGWFVESPAVWSLRIVNLDGVEQMRLERQADGTLQPALLDLENKRSEPYMAVSRAGVTVTEVAANRQFGEARHPDALTFQVTFPVRYRSVTIGFMVFTVGAERLFDDYLRYSWFRDDGQLLRASDGMVELPAPSKADRRALMAGGRPGLVQPRRYGIAEGWLPLRLGPGDTPALWVLIPMEADPIESWVGTFNRNTIILFCVILVVVFLVATLIMLLIERFISRLLASVKSILNEREMSARFGPFGELVKLSDGLAELAGQHRNDTNARAAAEAQLTDSRNRIELLLRSASEAIIGVDREGRITFCNPSGLRLVGAADEIDLRGKRFSGLLAETGGAGADAARILQRWDLKDRLHLPEIALRRFDRGPLSAEFWSHPIQRDGETDGAVFTLVDITVRKQVQGELSRLRLLLSNIIDSMPSALIGVDGQMRVTQWNRAAEQLFAVLAGHALGQRIDKACQRLAGDLDRIRAALERGRTERLAKLPMLVGGHERFVDVTVYPLIGENIDGAVLMMDDVTERMRMEDMMVQSEKMLSVGGLAAGMAHEINNPLAGILQNIQVIRNRLRPDLPANQRVAAELDLPLSGIEAYAERRGLFTMMEAVIASGKRAAKVVENMLSFSRKSESSYSPQDMVELLDQAVELAGNDYDLKKKYDFRGVELVRDYADGLPAVACEKAQIQQVILNLLRNGCQAMSTPSQQGRAPKMLLRLRQVGDQVCMQVEDNGPGMKPEVRKRVFEPFFTTKAVGVGTGLGLSVSYFIVTENHAGSMRVESAPGKGSCFTVCLPIRKSVADGAAIEPS